MNLSSAPELNLDDFERRVRAVDWQIDPDRLSCFIETLLALARAPETSAWAFSSDLERFLLPQACLAEATLQAIPLLRELAASGRGRPCVYELFTYMLCAAEESQDALSVACASAIEEGFATYLGDLVDRSQWAETRDCVASVVSRFAARRAQWEPVFVQLLEDEPSGEVRQVLQQELESSAGGHVTGQRIDRDSAGHGGAMRRGASTRGGEP